MKTIPNSNHRGLRQRLPGFSDPRRDQQAAGAFALSTGLAPLLALALLCGSALAASADEVGTPGIGRGHSDYVLQVNKRVVWASSLKEHRAATAQPQRVDAPADTRHSEFVVQINKRIVRVASNKPESVVPAAGSNAGVVAQTAVGHRGHMVTRGKMTVWMRDPQMIAETNP